MQLTTPRPQAILWDMDGTLIDQTEAIVSCYTAVLQEFGHAQPDSKKILRSLGGPMASTMALFVDPSKLDAACKRFRTCFPAHMFNGLEILPGAQQCIEAFANAAIPQAILTNKHGATARKVSAHCNFDSTIKVCFGNSDTEWSKPDPQLTDSVLEALNCVRSGTILVGDSPTDVATAQAVGIPCYGITTGAHTKEELDAAGAEATFPSLIDFLASVEL
jgi:phosphoglycolate phosphatase-like HAD superfamily hydrolase